MTTVALFPVSHLNIRAKILQLVMLLQVIPVWPLFSVRLSWEIDFWKCSVLGSMSSATIFVERADRSFSLSGFDLGLYFYNNFHSVFVWCFLFFIYIYITVLGCVGTVFVPSLSFPSLCNLFQRQCHHDFFTIFLNDVHFLQVWTYEFIRSDELILLPFHLYHCSGDTITL